MSSKPDLETEFTVPEPSKRPKRQQAEPEPAVVAPTASTEEPATVPVEPPKAVNKGTGAGEPVKASAGELEARNGSPKSVPARDNDNGSNAVAVIAAPAPVALPNFAALQARQSSGMDATRQEIYTRALTVEFMQVTSSYRQMVDRQEKLVKQVQAARGEGYPEAELEKLAIQFGWEVPPAAT